MIEYKELTPQQKHEIHTFFNNAKDGYGVPPQRNRFFVNIRLNKC